jgi:DNA-binding winged helix-turn-helix (wHTH) protein/Tol biopolymer transport system component
MVESKPFVFRFDDVEVREREFMLIKAGEVSPVEPKVFRLLLFLLHNPKRLITKEELLDAVWGNAAVTESSLTRTIALLRRLLGDDIREPRYIATVPTVGYRLVCQVEITEEESRDLHVSSERNGPNGNDFTKGPENGIVTGAVADLPARIDDGTTREAMTSARSPGTATAAEPAAENPVTTVLPKTAGRTRWAWLAAASAVSILLLAIGYWRMSRPLPPPRITAYSQITHDGHAKGLGGTDGSRLYFTESTPNRILEVGVGGGETVQLPTVLPVVSIFLSDISPDGSNALVGALEEGRKDLSQWVVPVLGGAERRLEDGHGGAFSVDGRSVIYSTANGDIFTVHIDGSTRQKLANVGSIAYRFRWSLDGKVIRFTRENQLWEMSANGTGIHQLLPGWKGAPLCCGRWTPDGSFFVFLAGGQIWALDERHSLFRRQSSVPIQLTSGPVQWDRPIPIRDGKTLFASGATLRGELSRVDLKTGAPQPFLGGISAEFVSFSPDGTFLAYVTFPEGTLWKANRDGSNSLQLTQPPDQIVNPRWSPDSKEIVFSAHSADGHDSIRRISAEDGSPLWLISEEAREMHDPGWSPDGKRVLFGTGVGDGLARLKRDLRIVDLESRETTVLPGSDGMFSPRWSPDGRYIAAMYAEPFQAAVPVFDLSTRQWRKLPVSGGTEFIQFSHDSRFIYFLRVGQIQGVFRIPVAGGKEERMADLADWHLTGHLGYSMSLDPSDAPLTLRDHGTDDIYALTLEP